MVEQRINSEVPPFVFIVLRGTTFIYSPNIQFTLELENTNWQGLPFLDTITSRRGQGIQVDVCRKPTHTDRYLDFFLVDPRGDSRVDPQTTLTML